MQMSFFERSVISQTPTWTRKKRGRGKRAHLGRESIGAPENGPIRVAPLITSVSVPISHSFVAVRLTAASYLARPLFSGVLTALRIQQLVFFLVGWSKNFNYPLTVSSSCLFLSDACGIEF